MCLIKLAFYLFFNVYKASILSDLIPLCVCTCVLFHLMLFVHTLSSSLVRLEVLLISSLAVLTLLALLMSVFNLD